jgi:rhodanese-related sulfurtransferase
MMNINGYESIDSITEKGSKPYNAAEFELMANETRATILDTRSSADFAKGFIPNAINIGINGDFAPWVGTILVDTKHPILIIADEGVEGEVLTRITRVGFDNVIGYLKGGFKTWLEAGKEIDTVNRISAEQFANEVQIGESLVLDVRKDAEFSAEHVEEAFSRPLAFINNWLKDLTDEKPFYIHCAGGYRSMIAASILQSRGYRNFKEVEGGFNAIANTATPKTNFVCQSKVMAV